MQTKFTFIKSTADGEQISADFTVDQDELLALVAAAGSLRQALAPHFDFFDDRLLEMNLRIITANTMVKKLDPQAQVAFHSVMEVMHGQRPTHPDFNDLLQKAIAEVVESLAKQGYNPGKLHKVIDNTYRQGKDGVSIGAKEPA